MALGGVIAFTTACSESDVATGAITPSATASPAADTATASSLASGEPANPVSDDFGVPAPAGKRVNSPNGSYMQSTISDDDPAMQLNPGLVDPSANEYSPADLEAAQRTIIRFMAEEVIDSRLNGDDKDVDAWWESNKHRIDPGYQSTVYQHVVNGEPFVLLESWQKEEYGERYDYITSSNKTRIYDRVISPTMLWSPSPGTIAVEAQVSYKIPVIPNVGLTGTGTQTTSGTLSMAVNKDTNGNWVINGFHHTVETVQG